MKRKYEIGFIINADTSEEDVKKIIDGIVQILKKAKDTVENVDEWGRHKLAFPIQKQTEGIYVFINTEGDGSSSIKVEKRLKLDEKVLRFIVLRLDDKLKKANRLTKKWKRLERITKKVPRTEGKRENVSSNYVEENKEAEDEA